MLELILNLMTNVYLLRNQVKSSYWKKTTQYKKIIAKIELDLLVVRLVQYSLKIYICYPYNPTN